MVKKNELDIPSKYAIASKYRNDKDSVGLFPKEFVNFDVNDLPLTSNKIDHYYFANRYEHDIWEVDYFDKGSSNGGFKFKGNKEDALNHLLCLAKTEDDDSGKSLYECRRQLNLENIF
ncbi:MAG: hypothetical protein WC934_06195 [Acidithiobacillus sp.]|jgi:hypothetical protein|uniref:hypothetical protein n=1 Tax=Acidithiobacillus sp. TaxID=1872118 RepID=UPI003560AABA